MSMRVSGGRRVLAAALSLGVVGCAASYENRTRTAQPGKLNPAATVYVAVPEDGRYGSTVYNGSGETVVQMVRASFLRHAARVERGGQFETADAALASARAIGADYAVVPILAHWEDRATEWSGLPDRAEVVVSILDARTGTLQDRTTIGGRSSWFTFGGDHPQDIIPGPLNRYVATLF